MDLFFIYNKSLNFEKGKRVRLIKKYSNRRLYDTESSSYITLDGIKKLVVAGVPLEVRDAKTDEDLTRSIMLQVILEEETIGSPLFSIELLKSLIRFHGSAVQEMLSVYLENNMKAFVDFQQNLQEQSRKMGDADFWSKSLQFHQPAVQSMMNAYVEQSHKMLNQMTPLFSFLQETVAAPKK